MAQDPIYPPHDPRPADEAYQDHWYNPAMNGLRNLGQGLQNTVNRGMQAVQPTLQAAAQAWGDYQQRQQAARVAAMHQSLAAYQAQQAAQQGQQPQNASMVSPLPAGAPAGAPRQTIGTEGGKIILNPDARGNLKDVMKDQ